MIKNVLIVDDDQEMLLSVKEGLEKYDETFSVIIAGDGEVAVDKLRSDPVSLVVTDLKMPRMNGFTLLAHIIEHYPDIPVIIITAYSTPEMEKQARLGGAVGYIEKPFMIEDLARKIVSALRQESEGGTLHGISSGTFLQLIEMEQKTCTIRVVDRSSEKKGVLFFRKGELMDARVNGLSGVDAAYKIFSWDEVNLSIQNSCQKQDKKIVGDLQGILLEAMRLKDEANVEVEQVETLEVTEPEAPPAPPTATPIAALRKRLQDDLGQRSGVDDIYQDSSWDSLLRQVEEMGDLLNAGRLRAGYVDRRAGTDLILLPGTPAPTVISVNPRGPKDRILQILVNEEIST
ncbi:MAG: response regulator [Deltaproteobacteria bacterium]|nr:response regulator [Deltaproteobacteria bacterium]